MEEVTIYHGNLVGIYLNEILNLNHIFNYTIKKNKEQDKLMNIDPNLLKVSDESG